MSKVRSVARLKTSAVDLVLHEIRRLILTGELPPGEPFVVQRLTDQLGVSHVPVREAMRQLQEQGLLILNPSRSAVVAPLDPEDLRAVYRLRLMVEPELAALSTPGRPETDLDRIEELLTTTFRQPATEAQWELHREIHLLLIRPAATEWDLRVLSGLWDASERFTRLSLDPLAATREELAHREEGHRELLDAARSRDPERVRAVLRAHLEGNEITTMTRLSAIPGQSEAAEGGPSL